MMKRDLKTAFRHVPISPCDYWLLVFEWNGQFFVDMFLPLGLRTAPRIFNLFAEVLHWVFETLKEWNVTHYLDDFLVVFPANTDITSYSQQFDDILETFGLSKATEKDSQGCTYGYQQTRRHERSNQYNHFSLPNMSLSQILNTPLVFYLTAAKLFPWDVHPSIAFSPYSIIIKTDVISAESIYPTKLNVTYGGGNVSSTRGVQFH